MTWFRGLPPCPVVGGGGVSRATSSWVDSEGGGGVSRAASSWVDSEGSGGVSKGQLQVGTTQACTPGTAATARFEAGPL